MSDLLYFIDPVKETNEEIEAKLLRHPEIKFVSLVAVDLGNNSTDEKIPISIFLEDIEGMLTKGVQTDGSSVHLPKIAEINNAKVDIIPDREVKWFVDYNYTYQNDRGENEIVGTLLIPSFLRHGDKYVCSRSILKNAITYFKDSIRDLFVTYPSALAEIGVENVADVDDITLTTATELEFWVKTPDNRTNEEKLTTSQMLKEQYWKRTVGPVRSAMEQALIQLDKFGLNAEMGHKEVGGVTSKVVSSGKYTHIMEQLEIDWKYSHAMQTADNELFAKDIIKDAFVRLGLDVTFRPKPIENVAGNGEHHHLGVSVKLKDGSVKNLFSPINMTDAFLNRFGWGSLMGILKNYEIINPFITSTNNAFNRLKVGFEAPICTVVSLGHSPELPSRNRTVLVGLIRDMQQPLATRFELRSPNPDSNTYLTTAACYQAMLDGIKYALTRTNDELFNEINKKAGEQFEYLEKNREYRSEKDVFEHYSDEQRDKLFGTPPNTVWENISAFRKCEHKMEVLKSGDVFTDDIIGSYEKYTMTQWLTELKNRIIPNNMDIIREYVRLHGEDDITDLDEHNWINCNSLRYELMKDSINNKSLFTQIREAIELENYDEVSTKQVYMMTQMNTLKELYYKYKQNLF